MQMYRREHYLAKLRPFYDDAGLIKVVTAFAVVENRVCCAVSWMSCGNVASRKAIFATSILTVENTKT